MNCVFIEAESLEKKGGWVVDTASVEMLGSAYLMAHGMGVPVEDASGKIDIPEDGEYAIYALTRDWTAVWEGAESVGKFKILIDGHPLSGVLGTNGGEWAWQLAGSLSLAKGEHSLALHDLSGFNGRCDCIYITDSHDAPSNKREDIDALRKKLGNDGACIMTVRGEGYRYQEP